MAKFTQNYFLEVIWGDYNMCNILILCFKYYV